MAKPCFEGCVDSLPPLKHGERLVKLFSAMKEAVLSPAVGLRILMQHTQPCSHIHSVLVLSVPVTTSMLLHARFTGLDCL